MNDVHAMSEKLYSEYTYLLRHLKSSKFQLVVKEREEKGICRLFGGIDDIKVELGAKDIESVLYRIGSGGSKEMQSMSRVNDEKIFVVIQCWIKRASLDEIQKIAKWSRVNKVDFAALLLYFDVSFPVEQQRSRMMELIEIMEKESDNIRYLVTLYVGGQTKEEEVKTEFEKLLIEAASLLYSRGVNVVRLEFKLYSISESLRAEWKTLIEEAKTLNKTYFSKIKLRGKAKDFSLDIAHKFLSSFPHNRSQLELPSGIIGNFQSKHLKNLYVHVGNEKIGNTYFPNKSWFKASVPVVKDVEQLLSSFSQYKNISTLAFFFQKTVEEAREYTTIEKETLLSSLYKVLPQFENVYQIHVNDTKIRDINGGDQIYEDFLRKGERRHIATLIAEKRKGKYNRVKLMVLGDGEAGKTSLVRSLQGQPFVKHHLKTLVAANTEIVEVDSDKKRTWQKMEDSVSSSAFARDLLFVSSSVVKTDKHEAPLSQSERLNFTNNPTSLFTEVLPQISARKQQTKETTSSPKRFNAFYNTLKSTRKRKGKINPAPKVENPASSELLVQLESTKNPLKVSMWDFGGQQVFDALHPLYLSAEGIYFIVFNLAKFLLDMDREIGKLKKWMISVSFYCNNGHIFLIGTRAHAKVIQKDKKAFKKISTALDKMMQDFYKENVIFNENEKLWFFPVENSLGEKNYRYLWPVRKELDEVLMNGKLGKKTWNAQIQLSWIFFMHNVCEEGDNVRSLADVQKQALNVGFNEKEVRDMLDFFGVAGTILNFSDELPEPKEPSIVLRPSWLLEVLAVFILCKEEYKDRLEKMKKKKDGSRKLIPLVSENGIMSTTVLRNLLNQEKVTECELSFIINVCEKKLIMSELTKLPTSLGTPKDLLQNNKFWIVPSFFVDEDGKFVNLSPKKSNDDEFEPLEIIWGHNVPKALFERFICSVMNHGRSEKSFRLQNINAVVLEARFKDTTFKIVYSEPTKYMLKVNSYDALLVDQISDIVRKAYKELATSGLNKDISAECDFHTETVQRSEIKASVVAKDDKKWDCFLSHTWGTGGLEHQKVVAIAKQLEASGVRVWLDNDQMNDNIAKQMVEGIDGSHVFVAFISQSYLEATNNEDSNAGKEFSYATSIGVKNIIPVVLEKKLLNTKEWNGTIAKLNLANKLYIDFSSPTKVKDNLESLVKRIVTLKNNVND